MGAVLGGSAGRRLSFGSVSDLRLALGGVGGAGFALLAATVARRPVATAVIATG